LNTDENPGIDAEDADDPAMAAEPSIAAMLAKYLGDLDGWNGIQDAPAAMQKQRVEQAAAMKKQANDFRDCFSTPAGRRVLEHFYDLTLRARPYPPEAMLAMDAITPLVIAHDAQCNFVHAITAAIAMADNKTIQPRSTT
jgi:hypothetical protein